MKTKFNIIFALFIIAFILISCSDNEIVTPPGETGGIKLSLNKNDIPTDVVKIIASVSREEYNTIEKEMNFLSNTSADIMFPKLDAGVWHLNINAYDESGEILYTGDTNVEVIASQQLQISLKLRFVGGNSSTGSIYIVVEWEEPTNTILYDYPHNPIIVANPTDINESYGCGQSFVVKYNNKYQMWYTALSNNSYSSIYYAESSNGITWEKSEDSPVITPFQFDNWSVTHVSTGPVFMEDQVYKMYIMGWYNQQGPWKISLIQSQNGIDWEMVKENVMIGEGWNYKIHATSLIKNELGYYLYFTGKEEYTDTKIGLAVSQDGLTFEKIDEPIIQSEGYSISYPSVFVSERQNYTMYYLIEGFGNSGELVKRISTDGINWNSEKTPVFTKNDIMKKYYKFAYPHVNSFDGQLFLYYTGFTNGMMEICLATE